MRRRRERKKEKGEIWRRRVLSAWPRFLASLRNAGQTNFTLAHKEESEAE